MPKDNNNTNTGSMLKIGRREVTPTDALKLRMLNAKLELPSQYMSLYEFYYGVQSAVERDRIRRTWNLRDMKEAYVVNFELMVNRLKNA